MQTEKACYSDTSLEHGIEKGEKFRPYWCCKHPENIWKDHKDGPPCRICPNEQEILPENRKAIQAFMFLDQTGREIGFVSGYIREEAIDLYLRRYGINDPEVYEKVVKIDASITEFRHKKEKEKEGKP